MRHWKDQHGKHWPRRILHEQAFSSRRNHDLKSKEQNINVSWLTVLCKEQEWPLWLLKDEQASKIYRKHEEYEDESNVRKSHLEAWGTFLKRLHRTTKKIQQNMVLIDQHRITRKKPHRTTGIILHGPPKREEQSYQSPLEPWGAVHNYGEHSYQSLIELWGTGQYRSMRNSLTKAS